MKSVIGQLDRDSLLVLYVAGELSAEDRRRVEGMLQGDAGMRSELEGLRAAQGMVEEGLDRADRVERLPVEPRVLERRVGRMMREWQAGRPAAPETVVQKVVGLKYPWWAYPTTAAAAIALAFLVWWGNTPLKPSLPQVAQNIPAVQQPQTTTEEPPPVVDETQQLADDLERSFAHPAHEGIREAEGQLVALSRVTEDERAAVADDGDDVQQQQDVN